MDTNPFDDKSKIKVLLAEPSSGMIDSIAHDNRLDQYLEFGRLETEGKFKFFTGNTGRMPINYSREMMANEAIRLDMDYLFMIDDDMIVPRNCFARMFKIMEEKNADLVAPLCTQRVSPFRPVLYRHEMIDGKLHNQHIEDYEPDSVVKVDGVGFGVVLISVRFLARLKATLNKSLFFSNTDVGEDIWFCIQARRALDAQFYADTSIKVGHLRHPEIATEWEYVKATKQQERFSKVYSEDGKFVSQAVAA